MESNDKLEQLLKQMYSQETLHDDDIDTSDIIDEEWTKFEAEHFGGEQRKVRPPFLKIAALFIGVLMLSGITYAAVHIISSSQETQGPKTEAIVNTKPQKTNHELAGQDISVEQICRKAVSARDFIQGVTFGGGEPTLQYQELLKALSVLQENGFHTAIESNAISRAVDK